MINGTMSSFFYNNFKYNVKLLDIPFHVSEKIKNEVYVFSDNGTRKTKIQIESDEEILFLKTEKASLTIEYKGIKTKFYIKNVTIKKTDTESIYDMEFKQIGFL